MVSRETEVFFDLGMQYYVSARFSAFAGFSPVCGNLFHHAVEMFLKGHLALKSSLTDLKKLGHQLDSIWAKFKQDVNDSALDRFNQTVTDLGAFESIRYPDKILALGMQSSININKGHTTSAVGRTEPDFKIVVHEIDELVSVIFEKSSVNPTYFKMLLHDAAAKEYLSKENQSPMA